MHMKALLEKYFFHYIDKGLLPDETPLFTGNYEGYSLVAIVAKDYLELRPFEVVELIDFAKKEVAL